MIEVWFPSDWGLLYALENAGGIVDLAPGQMFGTRINNELHMVWLMPWPPGKSGTRLFEKYDQVNQPK